MGCVRGSNGWGRQNPFTARPAHLLAHCHQDRRRPRLQPRLRPVQPAAPAPWAGRQWRRRRPLALIGIGQQLPRYRQPPLILLRSCPQSDVTKLQDDAVDSERLLQALSERAECNSVNVAHVQCLLALKVGAGWAEARWRSSLASLPAAVLAAVLHALRLRPGSTALTPDPPPPLTRPQLPGFYTKGDAYPKDDTKVGCVAERNLLCGVVETVTAAAGCTHAPTGCVRAGLRHRALQRPPEAQRLGGALVRAARRPSPAATLPVPCTHSRCPHSCPSLSHLAATPPPPHAPGAWPQRLYATCRCTRWSWPRSSTTTWWVAAGRRGQGCQPGWPAWQLASFPAKLCWRSGVRCRCRC